MFKTTLFNHLVPITIALVLLFVTHTFIISPILTKKDEEKSVSVKKVATNLEPTQGIFSNFLSNEENEAKYMAAINDPENLVVFGSSEFSDSPYNPQLYLPKHKNRKVIAVGHAHHQNLSVLTELLAAHKYNKGAKVAILLSPGWFENTTIPQAFVEFCRPNFLSEILLNKDINKDYKAHIGNYINQNENEFDNISKLMEFYQDIKNEKLYFYNKRSIYYRYIQDIHYSFPEAKLTNSNNSKSLNFDSLALILQQNFLAHSKNNKIYVKDSFYEQYLIKEDEKINSGEIDYVIEKNTNPELKDFKLLMRYIKEREMEASFVIIPLNPHFYTNLSTIEPIIEELERTIKANHYPLYNLFTLSKEEYQPGTLKDLMHFGDYGWMKVNHFLDSVHYE